jgi:hypothetical protein
MYTPTNEGDNISGGSPARRACHGRRSSQPDTYARRRPDTPGYAKSVRHVSGKVKAQVYAEYGIVSHRSGEYEVDHLISLELGGSNDIKNLWPESYQSEPWNAHVKDKLEDRLHSLVCAGRMSLEEAQRAIARDWIAAYLQWIGGEASAE